MGYVLESIEEAERLEEQSGSPRYDYSKELADLILKPGDRALDAGCGTGIVSRYLAQKFLSSYIIGVDLSEDRIQFARKKAVRMNMECSTVGRGKEKGDVDQRLNFQCEDLTQLSFSDGYFNTMIFRYVLQHVQESKRLQVLNEAMRCLKPGGECYIVDYDGPFYNVFPREGLVDEVLNKLETQGPVDLRIGRKLPWMLTQVGLKDIHWRIETMEFQGDALGEEKHLISRRLDSMKHFLPEFLGSASQAERFTKDYLNCLSVPGVVLFYNKFIVRARKLSNF